MQLAIDNMCHSAIIVEHVNLPVCPSVSFGPEGFFYSIEEICQGKYINHIVNKLIYCVLEEWLLGKGLKDREQCAY